MDPSEGNATAADNAAVDAVKLEQQHRNGANWFFWIAALSLVNSVIILGGGEWNFVIGLGITQIFDAIGAVAGEELGAEGGMAVKGVMFVLDLFVAGVFVAFGVLARKRHTWAFVLGMALYFLDGGLFLLAQDWLSVAFHAFALICLFTGLSASRKLGAMAAPAANPAMSTEPITP